MKETGARITIKFSIIPFGHVSIQTEGREEEKELREKEQPVYIEPKTTNPEMIEITFDGGNYTVPKTTGGFL
jgi:hypothetical protein